ncbi:hypothetical protein F4818DRAFT_416759 [Hypoxylon cercidicola]|nr:hypothetical protein F4818DRAFT_416759 [Hypoxylon cercidicola]
MVPYNVYSSGFLLFINCLCYSVTVVKAIWGCWKHRIVRRYTMRRNATTIQRASRQVESKLLQGRVDADGDLLNEPLRTPRLRHFTSR